MGDMTERDWEGDLCSRWMMSKACEGQSWEWGTGTSRGHKPVTLWGSPNILQPKQD